MCNERDDMETALFKQVVDLDKPAFGICFCSSKKTGTDLFMEEIRTCLFHL
ncbi:hypothetical protein [Paenibacillus sophorae]|uniref:hypothetical protein n=1 Tax=Paenibacillus sophorae TaxID=1333845 RepID=UPI001FE27898|nr:hypothetical protein [Paenibacillus sophorae]